jgi:geranyl-CoA carboxylase alpha subunit
MLGKLIAHAPTRAEAVAHLADGLDRTLCLGLTTNRGFLARVLRHEAFSAARVDTRFIEQHFPDDAARALPPPSWLQALAAAALALLPGQPLAALWAGWRSNPAVDCSVPLHVDGRPVTWQLGGNPYSLAARCGPALHRIDGLCLQGNGEVRAVVDGHPRRALFAAGGDTRWWQADGQECAVEDRRLAATARGPSAAQGAVAAPMHGRVTQVLAEPGHTVQAGALLLVMEAMKMEHQLTAPVAGTVRSVHARVGEQVAARKLLVEIAP